MLILLVSDNDGQAATIEAELAEHGLDWRLERTTYSAALQASTDEVSPDVLICAAREKSGLDLTWLEQLCARPPEAVRILLMHAGHEQDAMHAMEIVHRVLPEPLEIPALIEAVESVMELRALLDDPALKQAIGRVGALPAAPRQYLALTRILRDPEASTARVVEVVAKNPAVAAKVLRLTNSAYYSAGREISDLRTAVTRLGQNALRQLVLASEVFITGTSSADAEAMAERALRISQLAGQLLQGPSAELASTAGLLAEVGLLLPQPESQASNAATPPQSAVGAYLLGLWGLPTPIVEAVAFHERPAGIRGGFWVTGAVHVAAALVNGREVDEDYLRRVGQLDRLPRWRALADAQAEAA